jgi:hypothetical protein
MQREVALQLVKQIAPLGLACNFVWLSNVKKIFS